MDIIKKIEEDGEFVQLEDGFFYYWPNRSGAISSYELRKIADELDHRNQAWKEEIDEYFEGERFHCPINFYGCKEHCGSYGCGG